MQCSLPPASIKSAVVVYVITSTCQRHTSVIMQASMPPALPCGSAAAHRTSPALRLLCVATATLWWPFSAETCSHAACVA